MKKIIQRIVVVLLVLILVMNCLFIYIGNMLYDYTLNTDSKNNISQKLDLNEDHQKESRQWLNDNSQQVSIESYDYLKLHASLIEQGSSIYVIMVHGYRGEASSILSPIKKMKKEGYNLLIPDLRGHGLSEGHYIGMGIDDRLDIMSWIRYLLEKNPNISIILYGVSMGGATVMNVSGETLPTQVKAIIEDCGYTSVWDLFQNQFELDYIQSQMVMYMASLVTKLRAGYYLEDVKPIEQVKKSKVPILFIHGDQDKFVPYSMLNELYNAASCPKEKLIIHGAGHANSCSLNPQLYYQTIFDFIGKYTKK